MKCIHHQQHRCTVLIATSSELEPISTAAQEECTPSLEVDALAADDVIPPWPAVNRLVPLGLF